MDYKAHFYSPALGRFIQPDSIIPNPTNPQSWNRFSYVYNNPIAFTDPSGHRCVPEDECDNNAPPNLDPYPGPATACSIIPGYACYSLNPGPAESPIYVAPPASADDLTENGKVIMDYYVYLKGYFRAYQDMTIEQFLGLMMMYEINGLEDAQTWVVASAVDQLFAANHGRDRANPYCPTNGPCIAGIFNYLGTYSESAMRHATSHNNNLPPLLASNSTGDHLADASYLGNQIMMHARQHPAFRGIHVGNTWMKPWVQTAKNHLSLVGDPFIPNGLLALNGEFMAFSVTQENFWLCVMENGYGHC